MIRLYRAIVLPILVGVILLFSEKEDNGCKSQFVQFVWSSCQTSRNRIQFQAFDNSGTLHSPFYQKHLNHLIAPYLHFLLNLATASRVLLFSAPFREKISRIYEASYALLSDLIRDGFRVVLKNIRFLLNFMTRDKRL